ncbi:hypothetical protein D3C74_336140 [compost metagenome]
MNTINKKVLYVLIVVFMIFATFVIFSILTDDSDDKFMQELVLHQKLDKSKIESIRMSKVVLQKSTFKHIDIELKDDQKQKIINIFNSVTQESVNSMNTINSNISSGIVIRLKNKSEVRIQYDKKDIYVTRGEVMYTVEDNNLKEIFDNELKNNNT